MYLHALVKRAQQGLGVVSEHVRDCMMRIDDIYTLSYRPGQCNGSECVTGIVHVKYMLGSLL